MLFTIFKYGARQEAVLFGRLVDLILSDTLKTFEAHRTIGETYIMIIVTGGCGFIGSNLINELNKIGYDNSNR